MDGLEFITATPVQSADPARADIACFIGAVGRRPFAPLAATEDRDDQRRDALQKRLPEWLYTWLGERGWLPSADQCSSAQFHRLARLEDVPVPIDTWDVFDDLFVWEERPLVDAPDSREKSDTLLGAAVRSFFRQGGRKCYVVRVADPTPVLATRAQRLPLQTKLLAEIPPSPVDQESWHGVGHLFGLPDVSFLCLPDLPEVFSVDSMRPEIPPEDLPEERFVECTQRVDPPEFRSLRAYPAPRCDEKGFGEWAGFVRRLLGVLWPPPTRPSSVREVQFLAAIPLPVDDASFASDPGTYDRPAEERRLSARRGVSAARDAQWHEVAAIQSAFVQLTYPWLRTRDSAALPAELEPPDGTLAGLLANVALTRGAWHTPAREAVPGLQNVEPILTREELGRTLPNRPGEGPSALRTVRERVSVFGPTAIGLRLLSDVTTDDDEAWRPANVNRLMNVILRSARLAGEEFTFANNGERLWARVRDALVNVLTHLWGDGALHGETPTEAFDVRCDRSTMTQNDLDNGRVIAQVMFTAAAPIEKITVVLAMSEGGQISLLAAQRKAAGLAEEAA